MSTRRWYLVNSPGPTAAKDSARASRVARSFFDSSLLSFSSFRILCRTVATAAAGEENSDFSRTVLKSRWPERRALSKETNLVSSSRSYAASSAADGSTRCLLTLRSRNDPEPPR